jgi:hypothetical protein
MEIQKVIDLINSHPERAKNALENVYRGKVFIVTSYGRIDGYFKTRRGAEGYIKKQSRVSWYDDYSQSMVNAGTGLEVVEIAVNEIKDYKTDKQMWWNWFFEWLSHPHWADNIVKHAKHYGVSEELLAWIEETAKEVKETGGLTHLEEETTEVTEKEAEQVIEQQTTEQNKAQEANNSITVSLNEQFQGVEIRFTEKPAQEVIEQLKANGFKWSKRGFWYAKQSEQTLAFANSLTGETVNYRTPKAEQTTQQAYVYPEIDIDDLEQYTVSDELQRRLHSSEMFPIDYKKDCRLTFQNFQNEALKVLSQTDDPRIIYQIKKYLQSFKRRYYEQYLKILNHKANNPSWVVTGRGGLNIRRYNKMQDRYDKYLGESVKLFKEFKRKMQDFKWQIQKQKEQQVKRFIEQELSRTDSNLAFTTETREITLNGHTEKVRSYVHGDYLICRTWGTFRIFKSGKHIHAMKTTERLDDAKKYVAFLLSQDKKKLITV